MFYFTGDIHGEIDSQKITPQGLHEAKIRLKKGDFLIVLGDFGLPFLDADRIIGTNRYPVYRQTVEKCLKDKPYTILFIDGNHENFPFWAKQPVIEKFGGKVQVHPDAPNVYHLMRGEVYEIEGKKFFAFGGAASMDKNERRPNYDWWKEEICSSAEKENALRNLEKHGNRVDYVLTHTPPANVCRAFYESLAEEEAARGENGIYSQLLEWDFHDETAVFLDTLTDRIEFSKQWLCGHLHEDVYMHQLDFCLIMDGVYSAERLDALKQLEELADACQNEAHEGVTEPELIT